MRNFYKRDNVIKARQALLEHITKQVSKSTRQASQLMKVRRILHYVVIFLKENHLLDSRNFRLEEAALNQNCGRGCVPIMEGKNDITHCPELLRVLEGPHGL